MADQIATQKHNLPLLATRETCSGRTYIVTGANVGLGYEAAKHLASLGAAKVILAVRNITAGETAKAEIDAAAGTANTGVVQVWHLDLSSYDSVKGFAKRAATELDRIDALIENAAVALNERVMAEGHIAPITVNVLSTLLLAALLLPEMSKKAKVFGITPRVVVVTSRVGFSSQETWDKIKDDPLTAMDAEDFSTFATYAYPLLSSLTN
jgi:NAD(P)-dependent dehydrogenase (short-subunit alcohol dehydrogenase family)